MTRAGTLGTLGTLCSGDIGNFFPDSLRCRSKRSKRSGRAAGVDRAGEVNDPAGWPRFGPNPTGGILIRRFFGAGRNTAKDGRTLLSVCAHSPTMRRMETASATQDTRPARGWGVPSRRATLLRRLTPERFAELILSAGQRHEWHCYSAGRRGCAFALRADERRRARLLFEPGQADEGGPVLLLGPTEITLSELPEDSLPRWLAHLNARRNPAFEDAAFLRRLFSVLRL